MIKEEIQAQIDIYNKLKNLSGLKNDGQVQFLTNDIIKELEHQLKSAKSIKDVEKEAFESGRTYVNANDGNVEEGIYQSKWLVDGSWKFYDFEDYLKTKKIK